MPRKILLQTTIPTVEDDWSIVRFAMLRDHLAGLTGPGGETLFEVTARDRDPPGAPDSVISALSHSDFDAVWLFAVDEGDGLMSEDCAGLSGFRKRGGGLMVTRDHMDLGASVCTIGGVGKAHYFHSKQPDPDEDRRRIDDVETSHILWPNYHSGPNGDFQEVTVVGPLHPVLADPAQPDGRLRFLPAHPHEGGVGAPPDDPSARVIATGVSRVTNRPFNLAVAFEASEAGGRAVAQSTFHHFCDYNWDPAAGCPSFVDEPPGDGLARSPEAQASVRRYAENLARWLTGLPTA
ncbi:hypothetical protein ACO2Q0_19465 [Phenylobacterium sp. VNQ135]|uniref:hypothetical protein n=1 Tax=Phenylobacterium sp. VNQ135 TaxID=3400922 RepID=UPI003C03A96D